MKRNVTGSLLACFECDPPWVGTVADGFNWSVLDDCCPQCGNTNLEDILTDQEPEEYAAELAAQGTGPDNSPK